MVCIETALIVGGGIAGLSSAIALSRIGIHCEVLEKNDPKEGASLGISGRATDALQELGIYDKIYHAGTPFPHSSQVTAMRNSTGSVLSQGPNRPKWPNAKEAVGMYRPTLIEVMMEPAESLGVKIFRQVTFTQIKNGPNEVIVTLSTGEKRTYDLLVGADGIGSAVRADLFPDCPSPAYSGQWSIRWMAPGPRVDEEGWYMSSVGRVGFYYLPEGVVYVASVFNIPESQRMSDDSINKLFSQLLESISAPAVAELRHRFGPKSSLIARPFRWILIPDRWYHNRTMLIGDAAHATTAHMGMGGGMALEDSVVLAQCVKQSETIEDAFDAFMARRFDRVATVVNTSVKLSHLEQKHAPPTETRALLAHALAAISNPY